MDFDVIKEPWCTYQLTDGSTLRARDILIDVRRRIVDDVPKYHINVHNINVIICDPKLKGSPVAQPHSPDTILKSIEQQDVRYTTLSNDNNDYILSDGTKIKHHINLVTISRTALYNDAGDRIYAINRLSNTVIQNASQYAQQ